MRVTGIDHVVLRVADLGRSTAFYTEVIGCCIERCRDDLGMIQLRAGDALLDLVAQGGPLDRHSGEGAAAPGGNLHHLCLRIADFDPDDVRAALAAHGIASGEPALRHGAGGEALTIYLTDPDGNGLELRG